MYNENIKRLSLSHDKASWA